MKLINSGNPLQLLKSPRSRDILHRGVDFGTPANHDPTRGILHEALYLRNGILHFGTRISKLPLILELQISGNLRPHRGSLSGVPLRIDQESSDCLRRLHCVPSDSIESNPPRSDSLRAQQQADVAEPVQTAAVLRDNLHSRGDTELHRVGGLPVTPRAGALYFVWPVVQLRR